MILLASGALTRVWLQPTTYRGRVMACATATRFFLADDLEHRATDDAELTFVLFMCAYARDVLTGELPGPYSDERARTYARVALIPGEMLERPLANPAGTADALKIPVDELLQARATATRDPAREL